MKSKLGLDHPYTLVGMSSLADVYHNSGRDDLALPLFKETLLLQEAKLGPDHPNTLISMNNLAAGYLRAGESDFATSLLEEVLKRRKAKLGVDHPDTVSTMFDLGPLRMLARDYAGAEELFLACEAAVASGQVGIRREIRDDIVARLVDLYDAWGKPKEAEMRLEKLPAEQQIRVGLQRYNAWPLLWGRPQF